MKRVKPRAEGRSYAEVTGELQKKVKPEESQAEIRSIRQKETGGILLKLGAKTVKAAFQEAVEKFLEDGAAVAALYEVVQRRGHGRPLRLEISTA